jgi:hypothetical protein
MDIKTKVWMLACLASAVLAGCRREEDGIFEITDVSQEHTFYDSSFTDADCCVDVLITGELDGSAKVHIQYYPDTAMGVTGFNLTRGKVDSVRIRSDFFDKKIRIKYFPGSAKKGNLRIRTQVL